MLLRCHWELQRNSWCHLGWGGAAHPARGPGNVGLAAPPAWGVACICCSATGFPQWASSSVICFPSFHQQITISPNEIKRLYSDAKDWNDGFILSSPHNAGMIGLGTSTGCSSGLALSGHPGALAASVLFRGLLINKQFCLSGEIDKITWRIKAYFLLVAFGRKQKRQNW